MNIHDGYGYTAKNTVQCNKQCWQFDTSYCLNNRHKSYAEGGDRENHPMENDTMSFCMWADGASLRILVLTPSPLCKI